MMDAADGCDSQRRDRVVTDVSPDHSVSQACAQNGAYALTIQVSWILRLSRGAMGARHRQEVSPPGIRGAHRQARRVVRGVPPPLGSHRLAHRLGERTALDEVRRSEEGLAPLVPQAVDSHRCRHRRVTAATNVSGLSSPLSRTVVWQHAAQPSSASTRCSQSTKIHLASVEGRTSRNPL